MDSARGYERNTLATIMQSVRCIRNSLVGVISRGCRAVQMMNMIVGNIEAAMSTVLSALLANFKVSKLH